MRRSRSFPRPSLRPSLLPRSSIGRRRAWQSGLLTTAAEVGLPTLEFVPTSLLGVADPEHDDSEPRRLRPHLPDVGDEPLRGSFTDQAVAYYEERAKGGAG